MTKTGALGVLSATGLNPTTGFPYAPKVKDFIAKRKQQLKSKAKLKFIQQYLDSICSNLYVSSIWRLVQKSAKVPTFSRNYY